MADSTSINECEFDWLRLLPPELRDLLFRFYLGVDGLIHLRAANRYYREACQDERFWREFAAVELNVSSKELPEVYSYDVIEAGEDWLEGAPLRRYSKITYFEAYNKLIRPFRGFFNKVLWNSQLNHGELLTLTFKAGITEGRLWWTPTDIMENMVPTVDFSVYINGNTGKVVAACEKADAISAEPRLRNPETIRRDAEKMNSKSTSNFDVKGFIKLPFRDKLPFSDRLFSLRLLLTLRALRASFTPDHLHSRSEGFPKSEFFLVEDLAVRAKYYAPEFLNEVMPKGLFKGTYGGHGTELLRIYPENDPSKGTQILVGRKLRGDANVPAGVDSFRFPLDNCVMLSADQQNDVAFLENLVHQGPHFPVAELINRSQPFRLPDVVGQFGLRFDPQTVPSHCQLRVVGSATIAETGYQNPQSIPAHLIVVSPTRFFVLWLGLLYSASLFEKVSDTDSINEFL